MTARGLDLPILPGLGRQSKNSKGRTMSVTDMAARPDGARFINPNEPVEKQWSMLQALIKNPPENSRIVTITPELAGLILKELNQTNRKPRHRRVTRYGEAMTSEDWVLSGDTIKFGRSGNLLDGQNRLMACVISGCVFRTYVVFGIDDNAFAVLDSNAIRTKSDTIFVAGMKHSETVAGALRWLMIYTSPRNENGHPDRGLELSNQELLTFYRTKIDKTRFAVAVERAVLGWTGRLRGPLAAHLYLFDQKSQKIAKRFADDLAGGIKVGKKLPDRIELLRKQNAGRLHENLINAMIILAWNAYRSDEMITARTLTWSENKDYPEIE
jgi:hypothetical protein